MTVGIISAVSVILLAIYVWPHLKKKRQEIKNGVEQPTTDTENLKGDILKSLIHFLITAPATIIYFWQAPKLLCWLIESMTLQWAYVVSALLFVPIIGIVHYLWGDHWPIGKKQQGFALVALVALAISLLYIYYPKKVDGNGGGIQQSTKIYPSRSNQTLGVGKHPFVLLRGKQTHWLQIPGNMIYDVYLPKGEGGFALYYSDGTIVEFKEGENKELPIKTLATFRITARGERQHFTVTVKNRKIL